ncbi:BTB/POZ and MATH domain-containing protein 1-like isoform X2 [Miscanthus floridulus]|uniref:BTB/POZ and MATH domain-containing protein 1-like isoform X2 n=1 Tax=Miscanthus floridulus TaxID=154761 RepID=UPI003459E314
MEHGRTVLTEAVRKVQLLKIDGYCATDAMGYSEYIKFKWIVDGHEWEVRLYPNYESNFDRLVAVNLILLGEPQRKKLKVNLSCRLVDTSHRLDPSAEKSSSHVFPSRDGCTVTLTRRYDIPSGYLVNDSLTVQCTITVLKELPDIVVPANTEAPPPLPPSDLERHFGELWQGQRGADVTFELESGERFLAHKIILAARSPVFMAEFFGGMNERSSQSVRIEDMDADVFKVMLHFIYTDRAPELDEKPEMAMAMAQHLLAAADRSPETLDAVLATEGYNHLVASCPLVLTELLRAAHGRRN